MKATVLLVGLLGCASPTRAPVGAPASTPAPSAAPPSDVVDSGTFVVKAGSEVIGNETFTIRRSGEHLVLRAKFETLEDPENNRTEGELETDAQYRPVRAAFRRVTPADGFEYRLGGTPLTLDVTRDDKNHPQHVVPKGPVDIFIAGPGLIVMTPLCRVTGDAVIPTVGEEDAASKHHVEAYRATAVGKFQRIVLDSSDLDFELLCDGERLIAGGLAELDVWFVRTGREADLAALVAAARPPKKAWAHPVDETEPWSPLHTFMFDELIVTRDRRVRTNRLTSFALGDGKELAHRDFAVPFDAHVMCDPMTGNRLICANTKMGYLQILDARTLVDQVDLAPLLKQTVPSGPSDYWRVVAVEGSRLLLAVDSDRAVEIELDKRTANVVPMPADSWLLGPKDTAACRDTVRKPLVIGGATWSIDQRADGPVLIRTAGKKTLPPIALAFERPSLLACSTKGGGVYVVTHQEEKSVLAALAPNGTVRWTVQLGAHPSDIRARGTSLVVTTNDQARRVIAIDAATGTIKWATTGPLPATPAN